MKTLYEKQEFIEQHIVLDAHDKKRSDIKKKQVDGREHELPYGSDLAALIIPSLKSMLSELHKNKNQKNEFYFFVKNEHLTYLAGESRYKVDPDETLVGVITYSVISELSKAPPLMNVMSKVFKIMSAYYGMDGDTTAAYKEDALKFIGRLIISAGLTTGIYENTWSGGTDHQRLHITEEWKIYVEGVCERSLINCEAHKPMLVPPKKHSNLLSGEGGYLFLNSPLLKHPSTFERFKLASFDDKDFFNFINRIQETPYCVNMKLLSVIQEFDKNGKHFEGYITYRDQGLIDSMYEKELFEIQQNYFEVAQKLECEPYIVTEFAKKAIYNRINTKVMNEMRRVRDLLEQADMYGTHDAIYFPVFCDHRGRVYPYASVFSYQGCQMSKALIQHADKEAFTEDGIVSMFETLGNVLGYDKAVREYKIDKAEAWWLEHCEDFYSGNFNIFVDKQHEFDEPITALAIVLELIEHAKDPEYKSGFIAHRDARCSGASIIGTILRDKQVMEMTSVLDWSLDNKLGDAYSSVAQEALRLCGEVIKEGSEEGKNLMENSHIIFTRNVFKKAVMCYVSYGMTDYGLREHTKEVIDWDSENNTLTSESKKLFDNIMKEALRKSMPACFAYLDAVKRMAAEVVENKGYIFFNNPISHFPVVIHKYKVIKSSIQIPAKPRNVKLSIHKKTDKTYNRGIIGEAAPSIIHSLDSSLLFTVRHLVKDAHLTMIHDSIGSHPNYTNKVVEAYSKAMYIYSSTDIFDKIFAQVGTDIRVPKSNTCSDADLKSILSSRHIIC